MFSSGILELKKNTGVTAHLPGSPLCLQIFTFFESLPYFTLQSPDTASESIPFSPPITQSAPASIPTGFMPMSPSETTGPPLAPKPLQVFTHRPKVHALYQL